MADYKAYIDKSKNWWTGLPDKQKNTIFIALVLAAVIYFAFVRGWKSEEGYSLLFRNLSSDKAATAVNYLDEKDIEYKLRDDGRTILVSKREDVNRLKLLLAEQGVVADEGPGGNKLILEGGSFGLGEEQIKQRDRIAKEEELAKTLKGYKQIEDAKVHVTPGQKSAFVRDSDPAKASVTLTLKDGEKLTGEQIKGISRIVAGAVEDLTVENVTITDQYGNPLTGEQGPLGVVSQQLDMKQATEQQLALKAQRMLNRILGPGQAEVMVNADINFEEIVKRKTEVNPQKRTKASEDKLEIKTSRNPAALSGVPGTDTQTIERLPLIQHAQRFEVRDEKRTNTKWNNEQTQVIEKILPGEIKHLTIALALSEKTKLFAPEDNYEYKEKTYRAGEFVDWVSRDGTQVATIEDLVKDTVGFNEKRGDTISTRLLPYHDNRLLPAPVAVPWWQTPTQPSILVPAVVGILLLAGIAHLISRYRLERRLRHQLQLAEQPSIEVARSIQELAAIVVHNPEILAQTLREWMAEDAERPLEERITQEASVLSEPTTQTAKPMAAPRARQTEPEERLVRTQTAQAQPRVIAPAQPAQAAAQRERERVQAK